MTIKAMLASVEENAVTLRQAQQNYTTQYNSTIQLCLELYRAMPHTLQQSVYNYAHKDEGYSQVQVYNGLRDMCDFTLVESHTFLNMMRNYKFQIHVKPAPKYLYEINNILYGFEHAHDKNRALEVAELHNVTNLSRYFDKEGITYTMEGKAWQVNMTRSHTMPHFHNYLLTHT